MFLNRSAILTILIILSAAVIFSTCVENQEKKAEEKPVADFNPRYHYEDFAGAASCMSCHKEIYENHIKTAHFRTTEIVNSTNIVGSFDTTKNKVFFSTGGQINMEKLDSGFYQTAYVKGKKRNCERFDIVVGVGTQGQSYMSWTGNNLYQLPITYFTSAKQWSNSPGYPNHIAFNRPIDSRCLECHTTMAEKISEQGIIPELFDPKKIILGVTCEKCHGPGVKHVAYQTANPKDITAKYIINPKNFSRQQSLDLCAMCHGGLPDAKKPAFEFTAGDKLSDYFNIDTTSISSVSIDVHGNQYGMLRASKCFRMTSSMTCMTCHNPHENEKGQTSLMSQKCGSCHDGKHEGDVQCKLTAKIGSRIKNLCTDCHMPRQESRSIAVILQGEQIPTPASMHTHLITNYPEETKKVLAMIKSMH
jgi:nitrate/TMAO reductase-like tetraheme cytochrome c subunit